MDLKKKKKDGKEGRKGRREGRKEGNRKRGSQIGEKELESFKKKKSIEDLLRSSISFCLYRI